jgi:hypothetical protein
MYEPNEIPKSTIVRIQFLATVNLQLAYESKLFTLYKEYYM